MVRISSLPDLSRFVQREEKLKVYNTVHLLVGEESIEVSGPVISQASGKLQDLVGTQAELYLDQFSGEIEGVQDAVELLYGGEVVLTESNIKTVLKFSALYHVDGMFELCCEWIKSNISSTNFFNFIQFGLVVQGVGFENSKVLEICADFIKDDVQNELVEVSKSWTVVGDNMTKFLIQEDILLYTLPVLTSCVSKDADIILILAEFEAKGITEKLFEHDALSLGLLEKMQESVEVLETSKMLLKAQTQNMNKTLMAIESPGNPLSTDYRLFSVDRLLGSEKEFSLKHFDFVEMIFEWIASNNRSQEFISQLWSNVRQQELNGSYLKYRRNSFGNSEASKSMNIDCQGQYEYLYADKLIAINSNLDRIEIAENCMTCNTAFKFRIKLLEETPCFEVECDDHHLQIDHAFLIPIETNCMYFSFLTNSFMSVTEKIKKCWRSGTSVCIGVLYKCIKK